MLVSREVRVCLADRDFENAKRQASRLGSGTFAVQVDVADWESQVAAFEKAVADFGRIDYVFPIAGIGERKVIKNDPKGQGFQKPDVLTIDVDLTGLLYTAYLAIQQMRRQEKDGQGYRGKIAVTASVCGLYCVPTVPVYTAAKQYATLSFSHMHELTALSSGVVGFVRSYGKYLPGEGITLNAICPNVVRTNLSGDAWYGILEEQRVLTPMTGVLDAFASCLDEDISGECLEVGPNGDYVARAPMEHLDEKTTLTLKLMHERGHSLHQPER